MKKLYVINGKGRNPTTVSFLKKSAHERDIEIHFIHISDFDYTKSPRLGKGDGLMRLSTTKESKHIENFLYNKNVATFYTNYTAFYASIPAVIRFVRKDLPIIPAIPHLTRNREKLHNYVDYLGGFPIIVKAAGGMKGVGVMKIESFDSLVSVADYLVKQNTFLLMKKFIQHREQARLIVLGDEVIASHANIVTKDFRSNASKNIERKREKKHFSNEIQEIAVKATHARSRAYSGVDILIEENTGKPYLAEVNSRAFFPRTQKISGVDISGKLIDYLVKQAENKKTSSR